MKMNRFAFLSLASLALHLGATSLLAVDDREADHVALRQLRDKVVTGINNLDSKVLAPCFAKDFAFTTVNQTVITNQAQFQNFFDHMFHSKDSLVTAMHTEPKADILTRFTDQNTGICYGSSVDTYTLRTGESVTMNLRWTATVVKEDGQWKVAMAQAGTDFLDNPVLTRLGSFWKTVAISGAIGGLVLGAVLGVTMARRKKA